MEFTYYMTQRPPMPGAQPKQGLIEIEDVALYDESRGFRAYARLHYDRPLDRKEILDYELLPDTDQLRMNAEDYKGFEIKYNPLLGIWDVWCEGRLEASVNTLEEAKQCIDELLIASNALDCIDIR